MEKLVNIEDCLELFVGLKKSTARFAINSSDINIMNSIARQVFKGKALTDRQYALVKEKLTAHKDQFIGNGYIEFDLALENLRTPLRKIDRSKTISIVSHSDMVGSNGVYESYKEKWQWIKIRFPFSKKDIARVDEIVARHRTKYLHTKGSHEHFFKFTEQTVYEIVGMFKDKNFEIDPVLVDIYNEIDVIAAQPQLYVPGVFDLELCNVNERVKQYLEQHFGTVSLDNLAVYKDRSFLFGLQHFDEVDLHHSLQKFSTLTKKIVNRKNVEVFVDSSRWNLDTLAQTLLELDRFPLLILLEENTANDDLVECHRVFKNFVPREQMSVMFRLDSNQDQGFNEYVKNQSLNNYVDKNTKIVYINKNKLPKPLVSSDWRPLTALHIRSSRAHSKVEPWLITSDLVIHYDTDVSPFSSNFRKKQIEQI